MKKVIAILLSLALILSMAACGGSDSKDTTKATEGTTKATEGTTKADESKDTEATEEVKKFNGEKIVAAMYGSNPDQENAPKVWQQINDYFKEKWNIDVEISGIGYGNYKQNVNLSLAAGEQIDIFQSGALGFSICVTNEFCLDMLENDLIGTYGKDILDIVDPEFRAGCTVDGHLYGTSTMRDMAVGMWCIVMVSSYLEGIGFDFSTVDTEACNRVDADYMTDLFTKLHEKYPDIDVIYTWGGTYLNQKFVYDPIGGDNFGVLMDPVNSLTLSDLFTSPEFMEYCELMKLWHDKGFMNPEDATTPSSERGGTAIKAGTLMGDTTGGKPGIVLQKETERNGEDSVAFQLGDDFVRAEQATVAAWSISSNCDSPEAAMTILNDMYSDAYFTNLFLWGNEGEEYVFTEDGHIDYPEGLDRATVKYRGTAAWAMPCEYNTYVMVGDSLDLWEQTKEFNKKSKKSKAIGFAFDNSEMGAEYTALSNAVDQYINSLLFGAVDPHDVIPKLEDSLKGAGLETYMAEKQRQLNEWAESAGVK